MRPDHVSTPELPHFAVADIPFSRYGAWCNISPVTGLHQLAQDLHLVTHRTGLHPVLRLVPQLTGRRVETTWSATPAVLSWEHPAGEIQAVFETIDTVRMRGRGLTLKVVAADLALTPFSGPYFFVDPVDGAPVFTHYGSGRRYRIKALSGTVTVFGDQELGRAERGVLIRPDDSGQWEFALEEFDTARSPFVSRRSFASAVREVAAEFSAFAQDVAPWRSSRTPAAALAGYVLWSATVAPGGFLHRTSVLMSKHWMDKVWSWDHCFNAVALAGGRPLLALEQFLAPFDHQSSAGALPDSVAHSEVLYNFVKPPIHGWALQGLRHRLTDDLDIDAVTEIYTKLAAWSHFWLDFRRVPGDPLPYYQHGNDSGWDNATVFDAARVLQTADLAAFLIQQLRVLADLAIELGSSADHDEWSAHADAIQSELFERLWDGQRFFARNPHTGTVVRSDSLLTLLPIVLGDQLPVEVAAILADRIKAQLTEWGVATEPPESPKYEPDGYWRGPIWAPSTVLVENGLRRAGYLDLADEISARFRRLCERSGFAENFEALTGAGLRDRSYTWTASAYLLLCAESEQRADAGVLPEPQAQSESTH